MRHASRLLRGRFVHDPNTEVDGAAGPRHELLCSDLRWV
jgi:hypothetical protein